MGGAAVAVLSSPLDIVANPAAVGVSERVRWAGGGEVPFGLTELATSAAGVAGAGWGALAWSFGFSQYRETSLALAAARSVGSRLVFGGALRGGAARVRGFASRGVLALDLGALGALGTHVRWGASLGSALSAGLGDGPVGARRVLALGVMGDVAPDFRLALALTSERAFPIDWRVGAETALGGPLTLRAGAATEPGRASLGFGFALGPVTVDYAATVHLELGVTHTFAVAR
jgi:hypothetical protein